MTHKKTLQQAIKVWLQALSKRTTTMAAEKDFLTNQTLQTLRKQPDLFSRFFTLPAASKNANQEVSLLARPLQTISLTFKSVSL